MGEFAALSASAVWAAASLMFARLGVGIHPIAMNFLKGAIAIVLMVITSLFLFEPSFALASNTDLSWLAISGLVGIAIGDSCYFAALIRLGARRTLLMTTMVPPITAALAFLVLDEAIFPMMIAGMAVTMAGIIWVIRERSESDDDENPNNDRVGIGFAIGAVVCQSVGNVFTKLGGTQLSALDTSIVRLSVGVAGLFLILLFVGKLKEVTNGFVSLRTFLLLLGATLLGTYLGVWLLNAGLKYTTHAGIAATLSSTSPIFVLPLVVIFDREKLSLRSIFGALLAVTGVAMFFLLR